MQENGEVWVSWFVGYFIRIISSVGKRDSRGSVVASVQILGRRAIRRGLPRLRAVPTGNAAAGVAHARITQPTTREANRGGFALVRVREAWAVGVWGCGGVRGFAAAARSGRGLWLGLFRGDRNTAGRRGGAPTPSTPWRWRGRNRGRLQGLSTSTRGGNRRP